jgi:hypothetical protein
MTNSSRIVDLPLDVLLIIFKAQESFRHVSAFSRTCKGLYCVWKTHAYLISKPLLIRQTPFYDEIEALVTAENVAAQQQHGMTSQSLKDEFASTVTLILRSRQMAGQARYLCETIQSRHLEQKHSCHNGNCRAHPSTLVQQERDEITKAHHFIKLFAFTYANEVLAHVHNECKARLLGMSVLDKHLVWTLTRIMHDYALPWDKMRLGLQSCGYSSSAVFGVGGSGSGSSCHATWDDRFKALQKVTRVQVVGCQNCIYDDTARFSSVESGKGG